MIEYFDDLHPNSKILLFGCGGGYDIFCGLPLYFSLKGRFPNIYLGNFSFTPLSILSQFPTYIDGWYQINSHQELKDYSYAPEYDIARQLNTVVYTYIDTGLQNLKLGMKQLVEDLNLDIIILCDGGCDSIITGSEKHLGTPVEDFMSIIAVHKLPVQSYLLLLGATVDTFIEIDRNDFLHNINSLEQMGAVLETKVLNIMDTQRYIEIFKNSKPKNSIVNASIVATLEGHRGHIVPPLLDPIYCAEDFVLDTYIITYYLLDLFKTLERVPFLDDIKDLNDSDDIDNVIMSFHKKNHGDQL